MSDKEELGAGGSKTPGDQDEAAPAGKSGGSLMTKILLLATGLLLTVGGSWWLTRTKLVPRLQGTALEAKVRDFKVQRVKARAIADSIEMEQAIADSIAQAIEDSLAMALADSIKLVLAEADVESKAAAEKAAKEKPQVPTYRFEGFVTMVTMKSGHLGDREVPVPFDIVVEAGTEAAIEELQGLESEVREVLETYFQGRSMEELLSMFAVQAKDSVRTLLNGLLSEETPVDTVYFTQ